MKLKYQVSFQAVLLASDMSSIHMVTLFIPAILALITLLRYVSLVLVTCANYKEAPMKKLFRHTLMFASCLCETLWAGIISVATGALTGISGFFPALAKRA